ncbi:hypothetical protein BDR26DRAFT_932133 [Obelidium mucronatum]|nr:hypothetical protein BDR26DRAFT_932133 [Obelidium mucronatum]
MIRLIAKSYNICTTNADTYAPKQITALKILVDGTKLASLMAKKGKNDNRYVIVAPHLDPLQDLAFTIAFMEFVEQHIQKRSDKSETLMEGYDLFKNIKLFTASSLVNPISSSAHHDAVKAMHFALGVAIDQKGTHVEGKVGPTEMGNNSVFSEDIERVAWITGESSKNSKSAFHCAYFKDFPRSVVQYFTGMWPNGNHKGEFKASQLKADLPPDVLLNCLFPLWRPFEEAIKDQDHLIFMDNSILTEVDDNNEMIGLVGDELDEDETIEAQKERNAHHLRNGKVSLPAFGRTLTHLLVLVYGLASLFYHVATCPQVAVAVSNNFSFL